MTKVGPSFSEMQQFAALPWRLRDETPQILLVTTRGAGHWTVPKGWAEPALSGAELAAKEAFEEAGIIGQPGNVPLGAYHYWKQISKGRRVRCVVEVYPLRVTSLLRKWPEARQRRRMWLTLPDAAARIEREELSTLLRSLSARSDWRCHAGSDLP